MTEVADADGLGNVGASGHSELHGLLDVVAILYHLCRNAARVQSPAQTEETSLMLNSRLAYQMSSPLEVSVAAATTGEQHVLNASVVSHLHGNAYLVVGVDRHAEDGLHLVMVRLDEQRLLVSELLELVGGQVQTTSAPRA